MIYLRTKIICYEQLGEISVINTNHEDTTDEVNEADRVVASNNDTIEQIESDFLQTPLAEMQASVYFTLGSVIQGITIAILGESVVDLVGNLQITIILATINSLLIATHFWFAFMMAYYYLFRIIRLNAKQHFWLSSSFFLIGLSQVVAFQFLNNARIWATISFVMLLMISFYLWSMARIIKKRITDPKILKVFHIEFTSFNRLAYGLTFAILMMLALWYTVPSFNTELYSTIVLSFFMILLLLASFGGSINSFQARLDHLDEIFNS